MKIKSIIGLLAGCFALYWHKQDLDDQYAKKTAELESDRQYFLDKLADAESKVNPNGNVNQAPLVITGSVRFGGLTLNQLEVWLNVNNYSDHQVDIGDVRSELYVGGYHSNVVKPSNNGRWIIPAKSSVRIRLYARGNVAFPDGKYKYVKRVLAPLCGSSGTTIPTNSVIPVTLVPAQLDVDYLYYWHGGQEPCHAFDVPCDFEYRFAGWTVGSYEGYNAAREDQQEKNPSFWPDYYKDKI